MCGRYTVKDPAGAAAQIHAITGESIEVLAARYNVSPSQVAHIILGPDHPTIKGRWGLVPYWDKSEKPKIMPINARAEEAFTKPMFKQAIQKRRCAIAADGFYEWQRPDPKTKIPFHICRRDGAPFFFAGIYEEATELRPPTFLLFTTQPNELMRPIHGRMPSILDTERAKAWVTPGAISEAELNDYCRPYPAELLHAYQVSSIVNKPANDVPECIVPVLESSAVANPAPRATKKQTPDDLGLFGETL